MLVHRFYGHINKQGRAYHRFYEHINKQGRAYLLIFVSTKQACSLIALSRKQKQTKKTCENGLPYCLGFTKPCWFLARV